MPAIPVLQQVALALVLELVAQHVGLGRLDGRLGLPNKRLLDAALVFKVGQRGLRRSEIGLSEVKLRLVIGRVDHREQIAFLDYLKIIDGHLGDVA